MQVTSAFKRCFRIGRSAPGGVARCAHGRIGVALGRIGSHRVASRWRWMARNERTYNNTQETCDGEFLIMRRLDCQHNSSGRGTVSCALREKAQCTTWICVVTLKNIITCTSTANCLLRYTRRKWESQHAYASASTSRPLLLSIQYPYVGDENELQMYGRSVTGPRPGSVVPS
jgi:hypothetical protein